MVCPYFRPPSIVSGVKYTEWQRSSGLRVLRRVLDRQKILETTDGIANKTQVEQSYLTQTNLPSNLQMQLQLQTYKTQTEYTYEQIDSHNEIDNEHGQILGERYSILCPSSFQPYVLRPSVITDILLNVYSRTNCLCYQTSINQPLSIYPTSMYVPLSSFDIRQRYVDKTRSD